MHHLALLHVADVGLQRSISPIIEEAALIDGASRLQVFRQVVLPTALPGIIAASIFSMIVSWNDYLFGRVFLNSLDNLTLTVGVMLFFEGTHVDWGLLMAASVLMTCRCDLFIACSAPVAASGRLGQG